VIALMAWLDRLSVLREARQNALALTFSLAEQADSVFVATELALFQLEQAVGQRDVSSLRKDGDVRRLVGELMRRLPHLESLMLVDATGHVAAASGGFPTAADYVGDHEFFHRARAGHDGLHFSVPVGRSDLRATAFTASRPLQGGTGFPGAVAVTIHPEYFRALYRGTLISTSTVAAALIRPDGAVIVASAHMPNTPDQIFPASPARDGGLVRLAMADGTPGIAAFRTLPVARLTLVYLVSEVDVLAPWYARLTGYGLAAVLAGGAMLMLARSGEMIRPRPTWSTGAARDDRSGFVTEVVPSRISRGVDAFLTSALNALALARSRLPADAPQMSAHMSAPADVRGGEEASAAQALEGAVYGLSAAQRLMGTGRMRDAPQRIVDIRSALPGLQSLMLGSVWPPLQIRFEPVSEDALKSIRANFPHGGYALRHPDDPFGRAAHRSGYGGGPPARGGLCVRGGASCFGVRSGAGGDHPQRDPAAPCGDLRQPVPRCARVGGASGRGAGRPLARHLVASGGPHSSPGVLTR
ncbi:MAG: hypothetical protein B7Z15_06845, partial [Rhizobiales bacterium 32-66-8]